MEDQDLTAAQCRAARALLNWTQKDLATKSRVSIVAIQNFEIGKTRPVVGTVALLRSAFERAGVVFIPKDGGGVGVRLKK
jgi:transcriptional regulator with XRE-family HTH domain